MKQSRVRAGGHCPPLRRTARIVVTASSMALLAFGGACSKKRDSIAEGTHGVAGKMPEDSAYHVDNYKPAATFQVADYGLESINARSPLAGPEESNSTSPDAGAFNLSMHGMALTDATTGTEGPALPSGGEASFKAGFPILFDFDLKVTGGNANMLVNFGLMEAVRPGATQAERDKLHRCNLGSAQITHPGDATGDGGVRRFSAAFPIPEACLKDGKATRMMVFAFLDPEGAVNTPEGNAGKILVIDPETAQRNNICFSLKPGGECQSTVLVEPSPGVNARMVDFAGDSSVAVVPALNPAVSQDAKVSQPFLNAQGLAVLEGVPAGSPELSQYELRVRYDVCTHDGSDDDLKNLACKAQEGWLPLNLADAEVPADPTTQNRVTTITELKPDEASGFSAPLQTLGATFEALSKRDGGPWSGASRLRVRACVEVYKSGELVEQRNLVSQALNGDAKADDCRVFPVIATDGRVGQDIAQRCSRDENGALVLAPGTEEAECEAEGMTFAERGASTASAANSANEGQDTFAPDEGKPIDLRAKAGWDAGFDQGWGDRKKMRISMGAQQKVEINDERMESRAGFELDLDGYIDTQIFGLRLDSYGNMHNPDNSFVEPSLSAFGRKIYGFRIPSKGVYHYQFPTETMVDFGKSKNKKNSKTKQPKKAKKKKIEGDKVKDIPGSGPALVMMELCARKTIPFTIVLVDLEVCGEAGLYFDAGLILGVTKLTDLDRQKFNAGDHAGKVLFYATPSVSAKGRAEASINLVIVRGGAGGEVKIIEVGVPLQAGMTGGYVEYPDPDRNALGRLAVRTTTAIEGALDIDWLEGRIYAFADRRALAWCRKWFVYYPCGFTWDRLAEFDLVHWRGGNILRPFLKINLADRVYTPYNRGRTQIAFASSAPFSPAEGAIEVDLQRPVVINFNLAVDESTINAQNIKVLNGSTPVAGTLSYDANNMRVTFTPSSSWSQSTTYTVKVGTGVKGTNGSALATTKSYTFSTLSNSSLLAHWRFDGNGNDSSGNDRSASIVGASFVTDKQQGSHSISFDGVNDYVGIGNFDFGDTFTIALWLKLPNPIPNQLQTIISNGLGGIDRAGFKLFINEYMTNNRRVLTEAGNGTQGYLLGTQTNFVSLGEWRHFAFVIDKSAASAAGRAKLYFNGQSAQQSMVGNVNMSEFPSVFPTANQPTYIGRFPDSPTAFLFKGQMDDFRVYNRALTQTEITKIASDR